MLLGGKILQTLFPGIYQSRSEQLLMELLSGVNEDQLGMNVL